MKFLLTRDENLNLDFITQQQKAEVLSTSQELDVEEFDKNTVRALADLRENLVTDWGLMGYVSNEAFEVFMRTPLNDMFRGAYFNEGNGSVPESGDFKAYFATPKGQVLQTLLGIYMKNEDLSVLNLRQILQLTPAQRHNAPYISNLDRETERNGWELSRRYGGLLFEHNNTENSTSFTLPASLGGQVLEIGDDSSTEEVAMKIKALYESGLKTYLGKKGFAIEHVTINGDSIEIALPGDFVITRDFNGMFYENGVSAREAAEIEGQIGDHLFNQEVREHCQGLADEVVGLSAAERKRNSAAYTQARQTLRPNVNGLLLQEYELADGRTVNTGVFNTESGQFNIVEEGGLRAVLGDLGFNSYAAFATAYNARFPHRKIESQNQIVENACNVDERRRQDIKIGDPAFKNVRLALQVWIAANRIQQREN